MQTRAVPRAARHGPQAAGVAPPVDASGDRCQPGCPIALPNDVYDAGDTVSLFR
jgi:hypothetical protein